MMATKLPVKLLEWLLRQPEFSLDISGKEGELRLGDKVSLYSTIAGNRLDWLAENIERIKTTIDVSD